MAADNLPYANKISYQSQESVEYKVLEVQYGNGVTQRAGDGLNNIQRKWSVAWAPLSLSEYTSLRASLDAAGGYAYFLWTPPSDTQCKWVVREVKRQIAGPNVHGVSATLTQVFDYP